jgi:hypothetical protein
MILGKVVELLYSSIAAAAERQRCWRSQYLEGFSCSQSLNMILFSEVVANGLRISFVVVVLRCA